MTSTTIYHVPRYIVVYQSNFFKAPSAPPGAPRTHPDWTPFSSSPKLSPPPRGVACGGAWGPPWASESWESDLYRQFLVDLQHYQETMLCDKRLSVPITKAGSIAQAKGGCDKVLPAALSTDYLTASRSSANADPPHLRYRDRCVFHRNKSSDANPSDSA